MHTAQTEAGKQNGFKYFQRVRISKKNLNFQHSDPEMDQYLALQLFLWRSNDTSYRKMNAYCGCINVKFY
jgi:hypothetical protein